MGTELQVPSWANVPVSGAFAELNKTQQSLSAGIGQGYPVVYFRGKNWSIGYRGERKDVLRPDDHTVASYLDVIILGAADHKSKSYYAKWDPNNPNSGERPICSSMDGVTPDLDVAQKQADACALCPRNVWKSDANGRKGRECSDGKRLAVFVLPQQTALIFGQPINEPMFLRVPAASLNSLAQMGDMMQSRGRHFSTYVTRITFDPQHSHPKMIFTPTIPLGDEHAPGILKLVQDPQVERIINGGYVERPQQTALPPPQVSLGLPSPSTVVQFPTAAPATTQTPQVGLSSLPTVAAPPVTPSMITPTPTSVAPVTTAPAPSLDGFTISGTVPPASPPPASPALNGAQSPTVSDTGAPELADGDLDARIAARLAKKQ